MTRNRKLSARQRDTLATILRLHLTERLQLAEADADRDNHTRDFNRWRNELRERVECGVVKTADVSESVLPGQVDSPTSRAAMWRTYRQLEERGLVARHSAYRTGRYATHVGLTPAGQTAAAEILDAQAHASNESNSTADAG